MPGVKGGGMRWQDQFWSSFTKDCWLLPRQVSSVYFWHVQWITNATNYSCNILHCLRWYQRNHERSHFESGYSNYLATFFAVRFFGFIVFMHTSFSDKVLPSKYFVLSFLFGRCLQFPDKSGIFRENEFQFPFLYWNNLCKTPTPCILPTYIIYNFEKLVSLGVGRSHPPPPPLPSPIFS